MFFRMSREAPASGLPPAQPLLAVAADAEARVAARAGMQVGIARFCGCCRFITRHYDAALFRFMTAAFGREPLPAHALSQVYQVRFAFALALLLSLLSSVASIAVTLYGWFLAVRPVPQECEALHRWLSLMCIAFSLIPLCTFLALPMVVWCLVDGQRTRPLVSHWSFGDS
eukprot:TRINITY_DN23148_c0_g2_i3.p1 TRINITY_DN23148_c0_g2~~TRINITY_DN23148_c0_g2_i3.p1  ORF type:complete len:171 (+),score=13.46 TRINITY_DN23148_c0_g2_i3:96-608(+)